MSAKVTLDKTFWIYDLLFDITDKRRIMVIISQALADKSHV